MFFGMIIIIESKASEGGLSMSDLHNKTLFLSLFRNIKTGTGAFLYARGRAHYSNVNAVKYSRVGLTGHLMKIVDL